MPALFRYLSLNTGYATRFQMSVHRDNTRQIHVGKVAVGGGAPVSIQSMTNTPTADVAATVNQVRALAAAGCDIVRISVPDEDSLAAFGQIKQQVSVPLIADIHFSHRLAIGSIEQGADGIRINPGNIGSHARIAEVAKAAIEHNVPIRVGVNLGSVKPSILERFGHDHVGAIVENAREHVALLEDLGVEAIKVALKSSDVLETIEAYRRFAAISDRPLHVGVTESGTQFSGLIRSSVGIGALLLEGIGDTIRISLAGDPVQEVKAARVLLESVGLRNEGVRVIACPTCARANADVAAIATEVEAALSHIKAHKVVAVMGCAVNGPGEAREADMGAACDKNGAMFFKNGKPIKRIAIDEIVETILSEIEEDNK